MAEKRICLDCGSEFEISDGEIAFFQSHAFELPKRCRVCRDKRKKLRAHSTFRSSPRLSKASSKPSQEEVLVDCPFEKIDKGEIDTANSSTILYIIGNGFDRFHDVPSSYFDFRDSLGKRSSLRETLELYIMKENLWADFEDSLAHINTDMMVEAVDLFLDDYDAFNPEVQAADFFAASDMAAEPMREIRMDLPKRFRKWVNTLVAGKNEKLLGDLLNTESQYLNFNYTEFLESIYGVNHGNICYIHGYRKDKSELILGHVPVEDISTGTRYRKPHYHDKYKRYMLEAAQDNAGGLISSYDDGLTKKSPEIIKNHIGFFKRQTDVKKFVVIGHSLSPVDYLYFEELMKYNTCVSDTVWYISWYSADDIIRIERFAKAMGLKNEQIKLYQC